MRTAALVLLTVLGTASAVLPAVPAQAQAKAVTVREDGAVATLPAGWRHCQYGQLVKSSRCVQKHWYSAPTGSISVSPWRSRFRGDTCTKQHFTNGRPGPRIAVPKQVAKNFRRHGWAAPYANRTVVHDPSGEGRTQLFYVVCARTADRRVATVSFIGQQATHRAALTRATWTAAASIAATKVPAYLPGAYPKRIKPASASWTGDGSGVLRKLHWTSWSTRSASGRGLEGIDDCRPSCAEGRFTYYPVTLHAQKPQYLRCGMFFSAVVVHYPKRVPPHTKRTYTFRVDPSYDALELYTIGPCSS